MRGKDPLSGGVEDGPSEPLEVPDQTGASGERGGFMAEGSAPAAGDSVKE